MPKTKIVWKDVCMRLSKAKGFSTKPQTGVLSLFFDFFSLPNAKRSKRSKIKTFLEVSLASLTFKTSHCVLFF